MLWMASSASCFRNPVMADPDRDVVGGRSGAEITPEEAAIFMNSMQELAERTPHGIPILFKSNARNHIDPSAKAGINVSSGAFSSWPKEAGLAATRDMDLIAKFSEVMNELVAQVKELGPNEAKLKMVI